jgi:hypothetical protein
MDYFKEQIAYTTDESEPAKWVFDPSKLRETFLRGFQEKDMKELEELCEELT